MLVATISDCNILVVSLLAGPSADALPADTWFVQLFILVNRSVHMVTLLILAIVRRESRFGLVEVEELVVHVYTLDRLSTIILVIIGIYREFCRIKACSLTGVQLITFLRRQEIVVIDSVSTMLNSGLCTIVLSPTLLHHKGHSTRIDVVWRISGEYTRRCSVL